jgi:predicted metal-dependent phosphotriesterase family hydrolase
MRRGRVRTDPREERTMTDERELRDVHLDRRTLLAGAAGTLAAAGSARLLTWPESSQAAVSGPAAVGGLVLETVTGPVKGSQIRLAMAHEHLFTDFFGATDSRYMDVDWSDITGACVARMLELRAQGVNLLIEWSPIGIGRNVLMMRDVSRQTGMHIVCSTGIYKSFVPPTLADRSVAGLADHFYRELTQGIDGTTIRAGRVKIATTEKGPTRSDTKVHRAAARAAKRAGATIGLHSPFADAMRFVVKTLEQEGFHDLRRFVWGHAQPSSLKDHRAMAARGATIQYDAISDDNPQDPFWGGPTDDKSMLDRIQGMVEAGFGDQVLVSTDACVALNPPKFQYSRDPTYLYRTFAPKLDARIGKAAARRVLRDNVIRAFRRGSRVRPTK